MTYLVAAYTTANKAEDALEVLNRMVELEPDHINTLLTRVNVLFMLDKDADVIAIAGIFLNWKRRTIWLGS